MQIIQVRGQRLRRFLHKRRIFAERRVALQELLFSTEEQEREFRCLGPDRPLNSSLMYFDLIELKRKQTGDSN